MRPHHSLMLVMAGIDYAVAPLVDQFTLRWFVEYERFYAVGYCASPCGCPDNQPLFSIGNSVQRLAALDRASRASTAVAWDMGSYHSPITSAVVGRAEVKRIRRDGCSARLPLFCILLATVRFPNYCVEKLFFAARKFVLQKADFIKCSTSDRYCSVNGLMTPIIPSEIALKEFFNTILTIAVVQNHICE